MGEHVTILPATVRLSGTWQECCERAPGEYIKRASGESIRKRTWRGNWVQNEDRKTGGEHFEAFCLKTTS